MAGIAVRWWSRRRRALLTTVAAGLVALGPGLVVAGEPRRPSSADEVLQRLPALSRQARRQLAALERAAAATPQDALLALRLAQRYVALGDRDHDPRYYGRAQAAIAAWWPLAQPPTPVLALRAKLKEKGHQYAGAREDLRALVQRTPADPQAWLELANVERVQGRYDASARACDALAATPDGQVAEPLCRVPLLALTGRIEQASSLLEAFAPVARQRWPSTARWLRVQQAEIARAQGDGALAETHYRAGLAAKRASGAGPSYLMRAYADYLLDAGRPRHTLDLLRPYTRDNGVLLRAAIAARDTGDAGLTRAWRDELARRFQAMRERGGQPHGRFASRHALALEDDAAAALRLALANWQLQKEYRDTRNVLEAALAAGQPDAAGPVLDFLATHGTQDVALARLVDRLERAGR